LLGGGTDGLLDDLPTDGLTKPSPESALPGFRTPPTTRTCGLKGARPSGPCPTRPNRIDVRDIHPH
ncbi:hypothetical protein ACWEK7_23155, partial [Streptomyces californicus]